MGDDGAVQEAALVYRQFLLGWRLNGQPSPLSILARDARDRVLMATIAEGTQGGVPSELQSVDATRAIRNVARLADKEVRPANDDDALEAEAKRAAAIAGGGP